MLQTEEIFPPPPPPFLSQLPPPIIIIIIMFSFINNYLILSKDLYVGYKLKIGKLK